MPEDIIHATIKALYEAEQLLAAYLTDHTEEGFEELPEIDGARLIINLSLIHI